MGGETSGLVKGDDRPLRIAYFSPLPPERSGIADYSRELLPHLAQHAQLTLYANNPAAVDDELADQFPIGDLSRFASERRRYDLALYQMGNSQYHEPFFPLLNHFPGVVVLHDYFIHHFLIHRTLGQGDFSGYARELGYALGPEGVFLAHAIRLGQRPIPVFEIPLNRRVLDVSLGLFVHSQFVAEKIRRGGYERSLQVIPALIEAHPGSSRREELSLSPDVLLYASYGLITEYKQIKMALRAFRRLRNFNPNAHFLLVGETPADVDLGGIIDSLDLSEVVHHVGYAPDLGSFVDWIITADVVLNLRYPTAGETSATALRAMAAGRPLIVFNHGWYREIPDGAAIKTAPLDEDMLLAAMVQLAESRDLRQQMGQAGRRYTAEVCHPATIAEAYNNGLRSILDNYWQRYG